MKRIYIYTTLLLLLIYGCDTTSSSRFTEATEEKQFVWNGLNAWYFWQSSVADLADNRFSDDASFHNYLNGFEDERVLFNSLKFFEDDFSWFIDDYEVHEQSRQGISRSFGFRFGLVRFSMNSNDLFGYVQYVVPGTPADDAGLKRGDVFIRVNGTVPTIPNINTLLQNDTYVLTLADPASFEEIGETEPMLSKEIQENPIHLTKVIETEAARVGYLVLNAFRFNFHAELNEAFGFFKNENIDELVVDLRYNSGGALITSAILATLISGLDESSDFAKLIYNEKKSNLNETFEFFDEIPIFNGNGQRTAVIQPSLLNLDRVYVLSGFRTASASETVINGLRPYLQDVILIGDDTIGKDEGSITVYDNPQGNYSSKNGANPIHKRAMQPIVFKIFNVNDQDYPNGFIPLPENKIIEYHSALLPTMPELGDETEPLLARALELITGSSPIARMAPAGWDGRELIIDSGSLVPFSDDVYLLPDDVERID